MPVGFNENNVPQPTVGIEGINGNFQIIEIDGIVRQHLQDAIGIICY